MRPAGRRRQRSPERGLFFNTGEDQPEFFGPSYPPQREIPSLKKLATDRYLKILISRPAKFIARDLDRRPFDIGDLEAIQNAELANVDVKGRIGSGLINPNFENYTDYMPLYGRPISHLRFRDTERDTERGEMTAALVSYDTDSELVAISINNTSSPEFWQRILIDLKDLEEWDYDDPDNELKVQTQCRYGDCVARANDYDSDSRIVRIRSDSEKELGYWVEVYLDLNKMEQWLEFILSRD